MSREDGHRTGKHGDRIVAAARRRARLLLILTAVLLIPVLVYGLLLWSKLPDEVPTRWDGGWSNNAPIRLVDKTVGSIFSPFFWIYVTLALGWVGTQVWPIGKLFFKVEVTYRETLFPKKLEVTYGETLSP